MQRVFASESGRGEAVSIAGHDTQRSLMWEEGALMNGTKAIKVTVTKRQEVRLSSGEKEVY